MKVDIATRITEAVLAQLKNGALPWQKPWSTVAADGPFNPISKTHYRGANWVWLMMMGGVDSQWVTFKQAIAAGGSIRKGASAVPVVFWGSSEKEVVNKDTGESELKTYRFLRSYNVFNVHDVEGVAFTATERASDLETFDPLQAAETIIDAQLEASSGSTLIMVHGGSQAYYSPNRDEVWVPERSQFESEAAYYNVVFHELTHATLHPSRLDRKEGRDNAFGSPEYAFEELVAELGAAMLCAHVGIDSVRLEHSAGYIASWIEHLSSDPKYVVQASQKAQKAVDYLLKKAFPMVVGESVHEESAA